MATSIVLHVGPRKTGATYLQKALAVAAPKLREAGVLYVTRLAGVDRYIHVSATVAVPGLQGGDRANYGGTSMKIRFMASFAGWVHGTAQPSFHLKHLVA